MCFARSAAARTRGAEIPALPIVEGTALISPMSTFDAAPRPHIADRRHKTIRAVVRQREIHESLLVPPPPNPIARPRLSRSARPPPKPLE